MSGPMSGTQYGLLVGCVLGAAASLGGVSTFVIVIAVGVIGMIVGRMLEGRIDILELLGRGRSK